MTTLTHDAPVPAAATSRLGAGLAFALVSALSFGLSGALARGLLLFHGRRPEREDVLRAAGAVEELFHTHPSGVDHTVAVTERPVWFIKGKPPRLLANLPELELAILPAHASLCPFLHAASVKGPKDSEARTPSNPLSQSSVLSLRWGGS